MRGDQGKQLRAFESCESQERRPDSIGLGRGHGLGIAYLSQVLVSKLGIDSVKFARGRIVLAIRYFLQSGR